MVALNFISQTLGVDISWLDWFIAAAPFAVLMSAALYKLMLHIMPPEIDEIAGGGGQGDGNAPAERNGQNKRRRIKAFGNFAVPAVLLDYRKSFAQHIYFHQYHGGDNTFNAA